jgi:predicted metalloendopeptidase
MRTSLSLALLALSSVSAFASASLALVACGPEPEPMAIPPVTTAMPEAAAPPAAPSKTLAETGIYPDWMDTNADPCKDFFAYACGGFVRDTTIPADRATWGVTEQITEENLTFLRHTLEEASFGEARHGPQAKLGDYYAACMDEEGIEKAGAKPLKAELGAIAKVVDTKTLGAAITHLHTLGIFPLFNVSSQQDFKDATQVIAGLDQDGLGLPDRDYYLKDDGNLKEVREFYRGHVARMLALAGMKTDAKAAAADVLRIETKLAKLQQDKVARRNPYNVYHRVDRGELAKLSPSFSWDDYFAALGFPQMSALNVNLPEYFQGWNALLKQETPAAWRHYLAWQVVSGNARRLSSAFVNESFAMRQKLTGQKELEPRWKRCIRATDGALGEMLAQPYVAAKFAGDSKERADKLVLAIRAAMKGTLETLPWMDDATRKAALEKLGQIHDKVGYPDTWRVYDFDVSRASYLDNGANADRFELHRQLAKVGKPVDRGEWSMTPPTVNAYYDSSLNEIVLPAGELQPPFFSRVFYPPVNIGDEGANTIGHELTHAFDDEGSQFDGLGNLRDWWTKETKAKFVEATKCVQDQYSHYDAVPGVKLNGELTSGENIADIGGVKLGYAALQAWKRDHPGEHASVAGASDDRLFFLAYAQGWCSKETPEFLEMLARTNPHSPPRWRVNGPMADVPAFADAFQCEPGTPMHPAKVCAVW